MKKAELATLETGVGFIDDNFFRYIIQRSLDSSSFNIFSSTCIWLRFYGKSTASVYDTY